MSGLTQTSDSEATDVTDNNVLNDINNDVLNDANSDVTSAIDEEEVVIMSEEELEALKQRILVLKSEANDYFRQEMYDRSIELYSEAIDLCVGSGLQLATERSVVYSNRSAALLHCSRVDEALDDCNDAINLDHNYVKPILRRAQIYRQMDNKLDESLKDYQKVVELDANCREAVIACHELQQQINERNERLKTEMFSKLKGLGDLVLRPFGLSTDNFKMSQNPETGGYSVNFQNN